MTVFITAFSIIGIFTFENERFHFPIGEIEFPECK